MTDDRVTPEQVAVCLDRLAMLPRQAETTETDVPAYFTVVQGMRAVAVIGCIDAILMTAKWFPTPSDLREAAMSHARKMELGRAHDPSKGLCPRCHGHLWCEAAPVVRNGISYEMMEPCEACAPLLFEAASKINRERQMQEGRTVTRDTSFPFRVGDKIQMCRDVLADVEARAKAAQI